MANSRLREAFVQGPNLIGLAVVAAASLGELSLMPLLAGVVAEVAYLLFAPDSRWIRDKVERQTRADAERRRNAGRQALMTDLRGELRDRFDRLQAKRDDIRDAVAGDPAWSNIDLLNNLDYLLDKFLAFAAKEGQYRRYLQSTLDDEQEQRSSRTPQRPGKGQDPNTDAVVAWANRVVDEVSARYTAQRDSIRAESAAEKEDDARALLDKREQVLKERDEYLQKSGRALVNIHRQLTLLEDAFGLINDQIRARPPDQIKADLDGVLETTQMMTQTLDEMASFEQSLTVGGAPAQPDGQ